MTDATGKMLLDRLEYLKQLVLEGEATYEEVKLLWEEPISNTFLHHNITDIEAAREAVEGLRALFEHTMRNVPRSGNQKIHYLH